ncbi:NACHT domain-containing protein [Streptococcus suis]
MLIISLIENLLIEELGNYFRGIFGKIRLKRFAKRLKSEIEYSVLKQYGNEIYYLDFDQFLIEQDVLNKIIKNFLNQDILQSKTINQSVDFYINLFIEKYPKYKLYNSKIKQILQKYFEIIFRQLNKIGTPESQALCRTIREIIDGIDRQLQHITSIVDDNNAMLKQVVAGNFRIRSYIETLLTTLGDSFDQSNYFERSLFQDTEGSKEKDSLDTLLQYRKVVLKGEAGFGKTSEIFKLIISAYPVSTPNKRNIIDYFINFGIFSTSDRISFSHKLFKEFCAAYYITNNLTVSSDTELLEKLIYNEEWQEVVIFISGLFSTINEQDNFLDFVLQHNLPLYIECVNSKNDLLRNNGITDFSIENHVERILSEIHKTYSFIVENYFYPISEQFEPFITENQVDSKIGITGSIVENSLYYWFDIVDKSVPDVKIVSSNLLSQASQDYQITIFSKTTRMVQHITNLELSGLVGDSGRKIAIDVIKSNLKSILEQQSLLASNYILCELLKNTKGRLPWLKDIDELPLMDKKVRKIIEEILQDCPKVASFTTSEGVELFSLNKLLTILLHSGVNYNNSIIPGRDIDYSESNGLTMNLYSTKRKIEIVETFFNFAEASYLEMVKCNFPNIYRYFSKFQDMPYKLLITYKDYEMDPWICYYRVACSGDRNLVEVSLGDSFKDYESANDEILQSYQLLGRIPKNSSLYRSAFSNLLFSRNSSENTPLSNHVYEEIRNSLEEIFGKI